MLIVIVAIAIVESGVMLTSHYFLPEESTPLWVHIAVDTIALVLICLPLLWHFILSPLRLTAESDSLQARAIMDTAADGIVTIDERGLVRTFNGAAERTFGYPARDIIGRNVSMLMPGPHRQRHDQYLQRYLATGQGKIIGQRSEFQGMRQDGSQFPLELAVSEINILGQRVFTAIVRDLTAQKRAEADMLRTQKALREKEQSERALLDAAPESAFLLEPDGTILMANEIGVARFGQTREIMLGGCIYSLYAAKNSRA